MFASKYILIRFYYLKQSKILEWYFLISILFIKKSELLNPRSIAFSNAITPNFEIQLVDEWGIKINKWFFVIYDTIIFIISLNDEIV